MTNGCGAHVLQPLDGVENRLPCRHGTTDHERLEPGDKRSQLFASFHAHPVLGRDPVEFFVLRPVTMARHVAHHHREVALAPK
ncbi:hypothetical protein [Streptomyces sp. NPDC057428]|uniref:hypothetical protein n=1 Tax=Streptomyces sp. NPDC057428 TaxID=3346129 RepID=UPI00368601BC